MIQEQQQTQIESEPRSSRAHWLLELAGIGAFAVLAVLMVQQVYLGAAAFEYAWLLPAVAVAAYLAADLASGFVHFLADNFGSERTPILGPNFIGPFRDHHVDPKGITRNDFVEQREQLPGERPVHAAGLALGADSHDGLGLPLRRPPPTLVPGDGRSGP